MVGERAWWPGELAQWLQRWGGGGGFGRLAPMLMKISVPHEHKASLRNPFRKVPLEAGHLVL